MSDTNNTDRHAAADAKREPATEGVSTSRRRFTRAGLSASAILTLANRQALASQCSLSGHLSGNQSQPGQVVCRGLGPSAYQDPLDWPLGYDPGRENPLAPGSWRYPTWSDLENAISALPVGDPERIELENYANFAYPGALGGGPAILNPTPAPTNFNTEFSGSLVVGDSELTLMQALQELPNDVEGHAVAGLFNAENFGQDEYGYTPAGFKQFLRESPILDLLSNLQILNGRG